MLLGGMGPLRPQPRVWVVAVTSVAAALLGAASFTGTRFSIHTACMGVGFPGCMAGAVLAARRKAQLGARWYTVHAFLQSIALVLAVSGFWAIYSNKNINGKSHFTTWHGFLGAATLLLSLSQLLLGGVIAFDRAYRPPRGRAARLGRLLVSHRVLGAAAYAGGTATIILAMQSTWALQQLGSVWRVMISVAILMQAASILAA